MSNHFVRHEPCPECGSSDAKGVYQDGFAHCYACGKSFPKSTNQPTEGAKLQRVAKGLIEPGDIKALQKRKLTKQVCELYGYSVSSYSGQPVQLAPYYKKGKLVAQHVRFPNKDFIWTGTAQNVELYGQRCWPAGSNRRLVITEGEIDCLSVAQVFNLKCPVVSVPGGAQGAAGSIQANLEYVTSFDEICLAFDNDEEGKKAIEACIPFLPVGRVTLMRYPDNVKDCNDLLQAGLGQYIIDGIFKAERWSPDGIVSGKALKQDFFREAQPGYDILYPILSQKYNGLRKGELHIWTAGSGIGKSTAVHEIGYDLLMRHNLKLGVIALEENPRRTADRYVGIHLNRPLHISRAGLSFQELDRAFDETVGNGRFWCLRHFGSYDIDKLLLRMRYLVQGCECDFIFLDHISIVVSGLDELGDNERKLIDKFMTKSRSLVEETGVGLQAIVHLKRPKDGKAWNEGRQVSLTDLRGSGGLEQLSDGVTSLEGNQQDEQLTDQRTARVLKNRLVGKVGVADTLKYNHDTGRLLPISEMSQTFGSVQQNDCPF
jgi:twinkle protein